MLSGKTAVVTGASRGIGRAIAEKLAAEGAFVVINYNGSKEAAETVLAGIRAAGGDGCVMQCNVSDFAACEAWMKEILALYGKIDILVNNAGITKDGLLMGMSLRQTSRERSTASALRHGRWSVRRAAASSTWLLWSAWQETPDRQIMRHRKQV